MARLELDTPVQFVKGVGPTRAGQLAQLGIETVDDLLMYFPRRFDLRRQVQPIDTLEDGDENVTVAGRVTVARMQGFGRRPFFHVEIEDETASLTIRWFHGGYLKDRIKPGLVLAVSGKVGSYRGLLQMANPDHQIIYDPAGTNLDEDELLPVYPAGAKLSSNVIAQIIRRILPEGRGLIRRWFDATYLAQRDLLPRDQAIEAMHRPDDRQQWARARRRLAYEECLLMQLGIAMIRSRQTQRPAHALPCSEEVDRRIRARFPFPLTDGQSAAAGEIAADLARPVPMNRLLQGDVGCGKTVVALYAALTAVANHKQVAIMAPTELLARQHYRNIQQYLEGSQVNTALLVGGQPAPQRKRVRGEIAAGTVHIAVGTHALLGETIRFDDLALVIVDEQHKFGVAQRTGIRGKGHAPHYLVMTATPIPRTLALTVFGDLDVTTITELPPGRGETTTRLASEDDLHEVLAFVEQQLAAGQQAYFIYPLVTPSAELELTAANEAAEKLRDGPLGKYGVGLVHGQMKAEQKNAVMADFAAGRVKVLVASVVVEVGVDVPAANVMVIRHAERFGLAQLHQLRGRIGRGDQDATCILVASPKNPLAEQRMAVLTETHDGFRIAEEDLRLRGPGEFFGTKQHGLPELRVADLVEDFELLRLARRDAMAIIDEDPDLASPGHQQLRRAVEKLYGRRLELIAGA
jgi:ATP-dependent DNA helicase RecG